MILAGCSRVPGPGHLPGGADSGVSRSARAWLISGLVGLTESAAGLLFVVFGLVSVLINIVLMRVFLEFVISMIRTAQNTTALVERR